MSNTTATTAFGLVGEFSWCQSQDHLATAFATSKTKLIFYLYSPNAPGYKLFSIPKSAGGQRIISVPPSQVMQWQKMLLKFLSANYDAKPSVHGFTYGRSICSNASYHVARHLVLNVDIRDFFPSIHYSRIRGLFKGHPFNFPHSVASTLAQLCAWRGSLPQGAPTSPIISNLICRQLDTDIWRLTKKLGCRFTRYADDITVSTNAGSMPLDIVREHDLDSGIVNLGEAFKTIFTKHGFSINEGKVRIQSGSTRQEVTGLPLTRKSTLAGDISSHFVRS